MIKKRTLVLVFLLASLFLFGVIGTVGAQSGKAAAPGQKVENFAAPRVVDVKQRKFVLYYIVDGLTNESSIRHYTQIQNEAKYRGWTLLKETNATYEAGKHARLSKRPWIRTRTPSCSRISTSRPSWISSSRHGTRELASTASGRTGCRVSS